MKVTNLESRLLEVPVDVPRRDEVRVQRIPFVEIQTDEGITGFGQTGGYMYKSVNKLINEEMAPILEGENPIQTEKIWHLLQQELNPRVQTGVWSSAISTIDIALWDIKGKKFNEPVWKLLGGAQKTVPAYITFGLNSYTKEQLVDVATDFVSQGQDKLKMKVGIGDPPDPNTDVERVAAVRKSIGDDVELMIDANYNFSVNKALKLCREIEDYDIAWFEEPVYGNDPQILADLRYRTTIPMAAGQCEGHRTRHRALLEEGAIDLCQPNVCYGGGFTEGKKVATLAQAHNVDIANGGGWPYHNMHLHAGVFNGSRVEFHYLHWKACEKIYQDTPDPQNGTITLPEKAGLGLEPDRDSLEEYEVTSSSEPGQPGAP